MQSTFGRNYSFKSSCAWCNKLCTPGFGDFLPLFSADPLKPCQVGRGLSVDCHSLQRCSIRLKPGFDFYSWILFFPSCCFWASLLYLQPQLDYKIETHTAVHDYLFTACVACDVPLKYMGSVLSKTKTFTIALPSLLFPDVTVWVKFTADSQTIHNG